MKWHKNKRHIHQYHVIFVSPCSFYCLESEEKQKVCKRLRDYALQVQVKSL